MIYLLVISLLQRTKWCKADAINRKEIEENTSEKAINKSKEKVQRKEEDVLDIDDAIELKDYLDTDLMVTNDSQDNTIRVEDPIVVEDDQNDSQEKKDIVIINDDDKIMADDVCTIPNEDKVADVDDIIEEETPFDDVTVT